MEAWLQNGKPRAVASVDAAPFLYPGALGESLHRTHAAMPIGPG